MNHSSNIVVVESKTKQILTILATSDFKDEWNELDEDAHLEVEKAINNVLENSSHVIDDIILNTCGLSMWNSMESSEQIRLVSEWVKIINS